MIYFAADLHLQFNAWAELPKVCGDSIAALMFLRDRMVEEKPSAVILGGDIFDEPHPHPYLVGLMREFVETADTYGVRVAYVQGQHCRAPDVPSCGVVSSFAHPWLALHRRSIWLGGSEKVWYPEPQMAIRGFDNMRPADLEAAMATVQPEVNVLVLHQMCRGSVPDIVGKESWDFDPKIVPPHVQLVLMGDNHNAWQGMVSRDDGSRTDLIYSGSLAMQNIGEPEAKRFLKVTVADGRLSVVPQSVPSRKFLLEVVLNKDHAPHAVNAVSAAPDESLVVVKYSPTAVPELPASLREAVGTRPVHLDLRPVPGASSGDLFDAPIVVSEDGDPLAELEAFLPGDTNRGALAFTRELLLAQDPEPVIERMLAEIEAAYRKDVVTA